jgi:hypothetical protein
MGTVHDGELPVHAPDQPAKARPALGVAVSTTVSPGRKMLLHAVPQLMPDGEDDTTPPVSVVTVSGYPKRAETNFTLFIRIEQVVAPVQAPRQPAKVAPVSGCAVSVTVAPASNEAAQVSPQEMPEGLDVTLPLPSRFMNIRYEAFWKKAVTVLAASIVSVHVNAVPAHAPVQPANSESEAGAAVRMTVAPLV